MTRRKQWLKSAATLAVGAGLALAVQAISARWNRPAEAATIDQMARSMAVNLVQNIPWLGSDKIQGVAGLGDGRTFIVYTSSQIQFYQIGYPTSATSR